MGIRSGCGYQSVTSAENLYARILGCQFKPRRRAAPAQAVQEVRFEFGWSRTGWQTRINDNVVSAVAARSSTTGIAGTNIRATNEIGVTNARYNIPLQYAPSQRVSKST